jgi:hypothetical protein
MDTTKVKGNGESDLTATLAVTGSVAAPDADLFDPSRLRLSQEFAANIGVKKALLTIPVKKPAKEWFVQTHPGEDYRITTAVLELKEEREVYLVEPSLWAELAAESTFGTRAIFTAINRQGVPFLWPVRLPNSDGRQDDWNRSALAAATLARGKWVRVAANMTLGAYDVFEATGDLPMPEWPALPFKELLRIAFKDRFIRDLDHPILRRLRGEA